MMMDLQRLAGATQGRLIGENREFASVSTDSRTIGAGQLFIALRGERFDGHAFLAQVKAQGAVAALVAEDAVAGLEALDLPLVAVPDTRLALGDLARTWRASFALPLVAVTGSNGKTTTKEMLAAILQAEVGADRVLATRGNFNNDIGLPLTLLQLTDQHRYAVAEMGMNHPGEIAYLVGIAQPSVALVTNAQRAHLEGMGDLSGIAEEKGTIYSGLGPDGVALVNRDDAFADYWLGINQGRRVRTFGLKPGADVTGTVQAHGLEVQLHLRAPEGEADIRLQVPGLHNARNGVAAAAAALAAGASMDAVRRGLEGFGGVKGRLQRKPGLQGAVILDDTYNANPDSVRAGIDVLAATVGKQILVLGDMGEIGEMSAQFHDEIGGYAKSQGIDQLFTLGESSALAARNFGSGGRHFKKLEELLAALRPELTASTTVLVKGSRFMRMERVADALTQIGNGEKA